jgi:glycosyltransferase involved in cell wall biosynthesis
MRYTIVSETYPPEVNGVALTVQGLEHGLRLRGHELEVVRPRQQGDADTVARSMLVRGASLPFYSGLRFGLPATRRLREHWRRRRPDAIYVATEGPLGWSALRAARQLGIPAATGFHTRFDHYMRDYGLGFLQGTAMRWMRHFHNMGNATLVPTRELQALLEHEKFDSVLRLARAVDTRMFDPMRRDDDLRASWGAGKDDVVLIHVGRIASEKNLGLAVRAFRELKRQCSGARFVWVGDGPERERLQQDSPDFIFCGIRRAADLARHFASGDVFVFPSVSETFGNVTLEALASAVPTVAFNYAAAREHLRNGMHGALVAMGDEQGFINAVVELGTHVLMRRTMRGNCRHAVRGLHPAQVIADFDLILHSLARGAHVDAPAHGC